MPDEITIRPKSESAAAPVSPVQNQTAGLSWTQLANLCAAGLGVSFFLPWAHFSDGSILSCFDLQKIDNPQKLLWSIPIFALITIVTGLTRRSQKIVGQLTGALPFGLIAYSYYKHGSDLFHILTYGAYLSLAFGAALFILSRKLK